MDLNLIEFGNLPNHWQQRPDEMAHLALKAKSGRAMAIKQGCVNVSPCGGRGQDLVEGGTKRSEMLASIIVSP